MKQIILCKVSVVVPTILPGIQGTCIFDFKVVASSFMWVVSSAATFEGTTLGSIYMTIYIKIQF